MKAIVDIYYPDLSTPMDRPLVSMGISAGFPSPAMDFIDQSIDLNKHIIKHPYSTFFGRVKGNSMTKAGIDDGDLIIMDKSIKPTNGKIAVCYLHGEFTLKRLKILKGECWLMPENDDYQPIKVTEDDQMTVFAVVTFNLKDVLCSH